MLHHGHGSIAMVHKLWAAVEKLLYANGCAQVHGLEYENLAKSSPSSVKWEEWTQ